MCADLKAGIPDACDALRLLEVVGGCVPALLALACVVDAELGDLAQRAALLPEVDDQPHAAPLSALHGALQREDEVRPTGADVGAEHVRAAALVVHAHGNLRRLLLQLGDVPEEVHGDTAHRRQVGVARAVEECGVLRGGGESGAHDGLVHVQDVGEGGQVPHEVDGAFGAVDGEVGVNDAAVGVELILHLQLGDRHAGGGGGHGGTGGEHAEGVKGGDGLPRLLRDGVLQQLLQRLHVELVGRALAVEARHVDAGADAGQPVVGGVVGAVRADEVTALEVGVQGTPVVRAAAGRHRGRAGKKVVERMGLERECGNTGHRKMR